MSVDVDIENIIPESYKDIIFSKNELQYVHQEVKELEKKYYELKESDTLSNLDIYREKIKEINGVNCLIMSLNNKDTNMMKSIADSIVNEYDNSFVFFVNEKDDGSVNFIAKSSSFVNAGLIVKDASISSEGNGGGSATFAQGGGKTNKYVSDIIKHIEKVIRDHE